MHIKPAIVCINWILSRCHRHHCRRRCRRRRRMTAWYAIFRHKIENNFSQFTFRNYFVHLTFSIFLSENRTNSQLSRTLWIELIAHCFNHASIGIAHSNFWIFFSLSFDFFFVIHSNAAILFSFSFSSTQINRRFMKILTMRAYQKWLKNRRCWTRKNTPEKTKEKWIKICFAEFYFSRFVCLSHKTDSIELGVKSLRRRHIWLVDHTELTVYLRVCMCVFMRAALDASHCRRLIVGATSGTWPRHWRCSLLFCSFDDESSRSTTIPRVCCSVIVSSLSIQMRACARAPFGSFGIVVHTHTHTLAADASLYWAKFTNRKHSQCLFLLLRCIGACVCVRVLFTCYQIHSVSHTVPVNGSLVLVSGCASVIR